MKRLTLLILILAVIVAACGSGAGDTTDAGSANPTLAPTRPPQTIEDGDTTDPTTVADDPPGTPRADPVDPPVDKGPFFFDDAELFVMESFPVQVAVEVNGAIPTPCDMTGWKVEIVGTDVLIDVYSIPLNDPAVSCIAQLQDVQVSVPLGSFEPGTYSVFVNGEQVGEFEA